MPCVMVRLANAEDGVGILRCLATAFEPYRSQYTPQAFADTVLDPPSLDRRRREMTLFVALWDGTVVGTIGCAVHGQEGHLRGMAVLPACQGSGTAGALLRAAEEDLHRHGCTRITLHTTRPLQRAIRFYTGHGYRATGRVIDFFGMPLHEYAKSLQAY